MSDGGGGKEGGGGSEAAMVEVGGSKQRMVAECCPLLCSSDKDRLAPQVSSVRGSQARGQGRCMNKPAYKHLIITQAEEALWIKVSLFICFPFPLFGSLADFSPSLFPSYSLSRLPISHPHNQPAPLHSPRHNPNITWSPSVAFPTVFITGLPGGSQAPPSACCVSAALPVFLCLSRCLFVAIPVSPNLSFVCLALCLSAGLSVSPHIQVKVFWLYAHLQWNTDILLFHKGHVVLGQDLLKPWQQKTRNKVSSVLQ